MKKAACVIGLGSMGFGAATSLLRAGYDVTGIDLRQDVVSEFEDVGGTALLGLDEVSGPYDVLFLFVVNQDQVETCLFGESGALNALAPNAVVICCATVSPSYAESLEIRLSANGFGMIDAPVSGGAAKAAAGQMTVMASGAPQALQTVEPMFKAIASKIYKLGEQAGAGSRFKMVNQLLAGAHIVLAAEAMSLAEAVGLDRNAVYEVICESAGTSWMFVNRVPHILEDDYSPQSAVGIWLKDLDIVLSEAASFGAAVPMARTALERFKSAVGMELIREDDAAVYKVYVAERNGGRRDRETGLHS